MKLIFVFVFFFQAEDGIRDRLVTGVQTCALPISDGSDLSAKSELIAYKLKNIIVPVVDFDDATVQEAMDFIRSRAREMDTFELDPTKKGINFHLGTARVEPALGLDPEFGLGAADPGLPQIKELKLRNVPMATVRSEERRVGKECRSRWSPWH